MISAIDREIRSVLMEIIKRLRLVTFRFLLKALYIMPVNKKRILFIAFDGRQYSCNPKYVYEALKMDRDSEYTYVWVMNDPDSFEYLKDDKTQVIKNKGISFLYHILTSKVVVTNASIGSFIPLRKSQYLIETWHGGGAYKKTGRVYQQSAFKDQTLKLIADEISGFISSSRKFTETKSEHHLVPKEKFWEIGMPRNDVLFDDEKQEVLRQKVKAFYNIDKDTKIALYAPTLRNDKEDTSSFESLDTERVVSALKKKFGGEKWVVFFRMHYLLNPDTSLKHTLNVSKYDDSQELVCASDVMLSDYSSMMWDFSFTKRPCFVFAPDAEQYAKDRAFFTPIDKWPYPSALTNSELESNIVSFDQDTYNKAVDKHHKEQGSFENGQATVFVVNQINKWINQ